jgi:hypothetical protein
MGHYLLRHMKKRKIPQTKTLREDFKREQPWTDISDRVNQLLVDGVSLESIYIGCEVIRDYCGCCTCGECNQGCSESCFTSNIYLEYQKEIK